MTTFELFNSFPSEIHAIILKQCETNDEICLRLTCKYLYNFRKRNAIVSLNNSAFRELCEKPSITSHDSWYDHYTHRQSCHAQSWESYCTTQKAEGKPEPALKKCKTQRWSAHCECFTRRGRLYAQLRSWMPCGLQYCGQCDKFTKRKKSHKGKCYHGRGKLRQHTDTFWTHKRGRGAFGYKLWKKWVNNAAMNKYEARLRTVKENRGGGRYKLRQIAPKDIDTRLERGSFW